MIRLAVNKGRTLPLLELALELRHNRKTRRTVVDVCAVWDRVRPPSWLTVLQKQLFSLYNIVWVLTCIVHFGTFAWSGRNFVWGSLHCQIETSL